MAWEAIEEAVPLQLRDLVSPDPQFVPVVGNNLHFAVLHDLGNDSVASG